MTNRVTATTLPSTAPTSAHHPRLGALAASLVFAWRSVLKVKHVPEQLGDVVMIPILFTLLFTYLFGGALAGSTAEYLQYLLPGTLAMTVLLITMDTGIGINTDVASGAFDRTKRSITAPPSEEAHLRRKAREPVVAGAKRPPTPSRRNGALIHWRPSGSEGLASRSVRVGAPTCRLQRPSGQVSLSGSSDAGSP